MHTGQASSASENPLQSVHPLGTQEWRPDTRFPHQAHWFPTTHSRNARRSSLPMFHPVPAVADGTAGSTHLQEEARCTHERNCRSSTPSNHYPHLPWDAMSISNPPSLPVSGSHLVAIVHINTIVKSSDSQAMQAFQIQRLLTNFSGSSG